MLLSGVGEPFLDQDIRYICTTVPFFFCILAFNKPITKAFTRHIWLYNKGNYDGLCNTNWGALKHRNIDIYAKQVTDHILNTATTFIQNKNFKIRETDPP